MVADLSETHVPLLHAVSEIDVSATEQEFAATRYGLHKDEETRALVTADQELVDKGRLDPIEKMEPCP